MALGILWSFYLDFVLVLPDSCFQSVLEFKNNKGSSTSAVAAIILQLPPVLMGKTGRIHHVYRRSGAHLQR
jgi:hypothetical protein